MKVRKITALRRAHRSTGHESTTTCRAADTINSDRLPAYHRLDLRAARQVNREFSFYFEIINAYARNNVGGYSYSADYKSRKPISQLGFTPSFGVNYKF